MTANGIEIRNVSWTGASALACRFSGNYSKPYNAPTGGCFIARLFSVLRVETYQDDKKFLFRRGHRELRITLMTTYSPAFRREP